MTKDKIEARWIIPLTNPPSAPDPPPPHLSRRRRFAQTEIRNFFARRPKARPQDWALINGLNLSSERQEELSTWIMGYLAGKKRKSLY